MTLRFDRPVSRSAFWARRLALFAVLLFLISFLAHRFGPLSTPSLIAMLLVSALMAAISILLALVGFAQLWQSGAKGGKAASLAIFLAMLPLAPAVVAIPGYATRPAIRDVTTDVVDPPDWISAPSVSQGWLPAQLPVTPKDREAQMFAYPEISGRRYEGALDRVLGAVRKVAEQEGIVIIEEKGTSGLSGVVPPADDKAENPDDLAVVPDFIPVPLPRPAEEEPAMVLTGPVGEVTLQGETRSLVFGFASDVVIRMREEEETTLVDMRIASRYGTHDLGAGSATLQHFMKALDAELLGIAGG